MGGAVKFGRARAERVYRTWPAVVALTFWMIVPILCLAALAAGSYRFARHVDNVPPGTRGSYLVTTHSCQRQLCITGGTFTSSDGKLTVPDLLGDYRWKLGTKYGAVYDADRADVIPLPAHWDPSSTVLGMAGGLTFLVLWGWCLVRARDRSLVRQPAVTS